MRRIILLLLLPACTAVAMAGENLSVGALEVRGGPLVWPALLALLVGLVFTIERLWNLRRQRQAPVDFEKDVVHKVDTSGVDAGLALCQEKPSSLARVLTAALLRHNGGRQEMEAAVTAEARRVHYDLVRRVRVLGWLAPLAAWWGLLALLVTVIAGLDALPDNAGGLLALRGACLSDALSVLTFSLLIAGVLAVQYWMLRSHAADLAAAIEARAIEAVLTLDRKARQSIRLIEDLEEGLETKNMPGVHAPDLDAEFDEHARESATVRTNITTHASLPTVAPGAAEAGGQKAEDRKQ